MIDEDINIYSICRVGYALNPKKLRKSNDVSNSTVSVQTSASSPRWAGGGLADILRVHHNGGELVVDGVSFMPWMWEIPQNLQPNFDVIIHKLTEDLDKLESTVKLAALDEYLRHHPHTKIIDPIENVRAVVSRAQCCNKLGNIIASYEIKNKHSPIKQPKYFIGDVESRDFVGFKQLMEDHEMQYPVICKPIKACGTPESHHLVVVVSEEGFKKVSRPSVVQQYYNHDANFFKVYVIGNDVMVFQRPSLPNLERNATNSTTVLRSVEFDSRYAYPTLSEFLSTTTSCFSEETASCMQLESSTSIVSKIGSENETKVNELRTISKSRKRKPTAYDLSTLSPGSLHRVQPSLTSIPDLNLTAPAVECLEHGCNVCVDDIGNSNASSRVNTSAFQWDCDLEAAGNSKDNGEIIPLARFEEAAAAISSEFGLSLFGFDVIIPVTAANASEGDIDVVDANVDRILDLVVIDVNFFPSYKEVNDFPSRLRSFLKSKKNETPITLP